MIRLTGLANWRSVRALQQELAAAPETGTFQWGVSHCDKLEQLRRMQAAGVSCVPFTEDFAQAYDNVRSGQVWLGRKVNHTKGKDIKLPNHKLWRVRDFWTHYIPSFAEWRIHVFDGKSIARGVKEYVGESLLATLHSEIHIRARANDYRLDHTPDPPKGMRDLAKAAVHAIQEPYGAVDILVGDDKKMYVLEVNVAPAMDDYTRAAYVKAIRARFTGAAAIAR